MRRSFADHALDWSGRVLVALILGFVLLPFVVVAIASFNDGALLRFPPENWSLRWYRNAFAYADFAKGLWNSLWIAAIGSTGALVAGAGFAYVLDRYDFRLKPGLHAVLMAPLVIPNFTIGLGLLILAASLAMPRGHGLIAFLHVIIVLPFVIRSVYVSLQNLDARLEAAASSLGAAPGRVLRTVTAPLLAPGLAAGWLFAAILSFNEFTASLFVVSRNTQTLPVAMYNYVREYADPTLAAISVIYVVAVACVLLVVHRLFRLEKVLNVE
jgi:putative spermidine/putrescine transport system permease protein